MIHYCALFQHASKNRAFQDPKASTTVCLQMNKEREPRQDLAPTWTEGRSGGVGNMGQQRTSVIKRLCLMKGNFISLTTAKYH